MKKIGEMLLAWIFTVPAAAIVGYAVMSMTKLPDPWGWVVSLTAIAVLLIWAGRLMLHAENADDIEEMLPSEAELHQYHTVPHPDLHPYEGPPHVNHHEHEGHDHPQAKDNPLP
jgi:membrane protein implicated in regulation of membrane protease activity